MKATRKLSVVLASGAVAVALAVTATGLVGASTSSAAKSAKSAAQASGSVRSSVRSPSVASAASVESTSGTTDSRVLHRPDEQVNPGTDTGNWSSMYEFMQYVVEDTAAVWNWYYQQWGYGSSSVNYVFPAPGEQVATGCGDVTNDNTMEYCPADDTIYFSQSIATRLWDGSFVGPDGQSLGGAAGGDFATVFLLAHEYGHNVQAELGIQATVPQMEQQADCYSGAFAHVAYYQGILDANDINEGVAGAFLAGDSAFDNPGHHGTSQERINAFWLGYNADGPAACDAILQG